GIAPDRWASPGGVFEPLVPLAARVMDEKHIRAAQNGEYLTGMTFWTILNYAVWRRLWIQGEPVERLHGELEEAIARG
ncbi:MAG: hypothetical protein Q8Q14_15110, partial [Gemmatimonadales bacterium]|nr:hypothetical protein [Gemmatimonadales bacterium]